MKEPQKRSKAKDQKPRPPIPGGKVAARLAQLQSERGIDAAEPLEAADAPVAAMAAGAPAPPASPYAAAYAMVADTAVAPAVEEVETGWRPLGPYSIPHGQTYGGGPGSRPSVSGRISAIAVDPGDDQHILIGAGGGGIWETRDAGRTWEPRGDAQPSLAIGALAFDPSNPNVVYAGTGEGNALYWLGLGVLQSTDGGANWSPLPDRQFEGTGFFDLAVDPLDGNRLIAGTLRGLYVSTDGGMTWTRKHRHTTWSVSIHPAIPGVPDSTHEVLAACRDGLFRSTDAGENWLEVNLPNGPANWHAVQGEGRLEVRHAPSNGSIVYVCGAGMPFRTEVFFGQSYSTPTPYLWRRDIFGGTFQLETLPGSLSTIQASYDWISAVSPNNPDLFFIGSIQLHRGVRAPDGSWDWSNLSARLLGDSIHPDQHAIGFSTTNPNVIYAGNDGGLYRSPDGGARWQSLNKGLSITELEYLAQHPEHEAYLLAGTQDNGTLRYEGEEAWYHVQDGDGGDCAVNEASPQICYHTFYGMSIERSKKGGERGSWGALKMAVIASEDYGAGGSLFYPPVEAKNSVIAQASLSIYVSREDGDKDTWARIPLPAGAGLASALAMPTESRIYVGTTEGRVYRTDFEQDEWQTPVKLSGPDNGYISDLLVDPSDSTQIWAAFSNGPLGQIIVRLDEGNGTWTDASTGLPGDLAANAIEIDPANPRVLWVAMDVGVWRTIDGGASWHTYSNLLPNSLIKDLLFHAPSRLLRAATQSRGVWEIAVDQAQVPATELYLRDSSVDTGRLSPSPSDVKDPFRIGSRTHWYQCKDIKIDAAPFHTAQAEEMDFEIFEDDRGPFATGLMQETLQPNQPARIFVQVHNRGPKPATDVSVKLFYAPASVGFPDLPVGFWAGFPDNDLPVDSPWQPVAPHTVIPSVRSIRGEIVGFEWDPPSVIGAAVTLLAIVTSPDDPLASNERNVAALVRNHKNCGLKSLAAVNPPAAEGPHLGAIRLDLWGGEGNEPYTLASDRGARGMIRGIVFSKRLSEAALSAGLPQVELGTREQADLDWILRCNPGLTEELDLTVAYRAPRRGTWLPTFPIDAGKSEPIIVLTEPKPYRGHWTLSQRTTSGVEVGGFTLLSRRT